MDRSKLCSKTRQEVADEYGVSRKTFGRWLKDAGISPGRGRLTPAILNQIYDHFGEPRRLRW
jgi:DNA-binding XRE family transcriptional regulator